MSVLSALDKIVKAMDARHVGLAKFGAIAAFAAGTLFLSSVQGHGPSREPDCNMWLAARGPQLKDWALGYLSGMSLVWNAEHKAPAEPLSEISSREEVFTWLNGYCRANPQQPLGRALIVLFFEMVKRKEGR
jgi:hypothetical protein